MPGELPLTTLLSQALIAYTIEFDNEYERRAPHSATAKHGAGLRGGGPWLVSQVMWTNHLRFVRDSGTPVRELQALACVSQPVIKSRLNHLGWWGYVVPGKDPADKRAKPPTGDLLVHLTDAGRNACAIWEPLNAIVDKRWTSRFGKALIEQLRSALEPIVASQDERLPDAMPVVDYADGMHATLVLPDARPHPQPPLEKLGLSALLARTLLAMTLAFEARADLSLTVAADVLRVLDDTGVPTNVMPARAGVSKEGMSAALNFLAKKGYVSVGPSKEKLVKPTAKGKRARDTYRATVDDVESDLARAVGKRTVSSLRSALSELDAPVKGFNSGLAAAIDPPEGGWRLLKQYAKQTQAMLENPRATIPHHPMVLHRGGYPDGS